VVVSLVAAILGSTLASAALADAPSVTAQNVAAPDNTVDASLVLAFPAALSTGLSTGVGASYARRLDPRGTFALGARASWSTATEYSLIESVRNDDVRMRAFGTIQHVAGRGSFGLRLGLGATAVYEGRTRAQGSRAGLSGSALEQTAWYLFPAADLDLVAALAVWNRWGMSISGGPTLHWIDGSARTGWSTSLGVAWQP
jgi:hypothetical protein